MSEAGGATGGQASGLTPVEIVDRLASLPRLEAIPRRELDWLVGHGRLAGHDAGTVIARKGERIEYLWVILSGRLTARADRGTGPRRVITWLPGDVSGMLPFSRMKGPPGDNYLEERSEILALHESHFPEMVHQCPEFTAYTVHLMLDRARSFKASDLQDEKMISLGKLAAGLAHELNNPASAAVRGAKLLREGLAATDDALRALGASGLSGQQLEAIERIRSACLAGPAIEGLSPLEQADREDVILDWLERHRADPAHAGPIAETAVTVETLDALADTLASSEEALDAALGWIAAGCSTHSLALDIEHAVTRIHELVSAVKRFSYMDRLAAPESVDVEAGLRDTLRVMASRVKSKDAEVTLDIEAGLPPAHAVGGELNQVWLNLIDNALDAIPQGGHVRITARREGDGLTIRFVDDGAGIGPEALPHIFDPFFTTKAPGDGIGMGLDIVRRLVRGNRGEISVESRAGETEFRVDLAAAATPASPGP